MFMLTIIYFLIVGTYNLCLFLIAGLDAEHGVSFWISYGFMMLSFLLTGLGFIMVRNKRVVPCDAFLGFSVHKHSAIYLVVCFVLSTVFMLLDSNDLTWEWPFVVQFIALVIHLIFYIACFFVQETVHTFEKQIKEANIFTTNLQSKAEFVSHKATDPAVKAAFKKLAEQIRFSDPVSTPKLESLEKQIKAQIKKGEHYATKNDNEKALLACEKASALLVERNMKCRALK